MVERDRIRGRKESGEQKPWTTDWVFHHTYFCNVRREDDRVTRYIRERYTLEALGANLEVAICLARWLNWPSTLDRIPLAVHTIPGNVEEILVERQQKGEKVFGDAYIVSTNGLAMPKALYVARNLLPAALERLGAAANWRACWGSGPLQMAFEGLSMVRGLGSFMAGQILADLKNTEGHPLEGAEDWWTFAVPGPGSLRGISWIVYGQNDKQNPSMFIGDLRMIRETLEELGNPLIDEICNQDLQNCLCEFDKYCRVLTGAGRSKRKYNGV